MGGIERLLRIDERLLRLGWPVVRELDALQVEGGDVVVLCAGFEERATFALENIVKGGAKGLTAVVVEYAPEYGENQKSAMARLCEEGGLSVEWVQYDRCLPAGAGVTMASRTRGAGRVYIDVSAMSRMLIVQLLVALAAEIGGLAGVTVLYTEAEKYPPTKAGVEAGLGGVGGGARVDSYISSGVWELAAVPELSAPIAESEATRLVVFPSFNPAQLKLLLQELQPTFVELISGVPPRLENQWRPGAILRCNEVAVRGLRGVNVHEASTLDYRDTLRVILELYDKRSAFDKLVCSPSGSKMQSVAVGVARCFLEDLQIVYPTPQVFLDPAGHTLGARRTYGLDLGAFAALGAAHGR